MKYVVKGQKPAQGYCYRSRCSEDCAIVCYSNCGSVCWVNSGSGSNDEE